MEFPAGRSKVAFFAFAFVAMVLASCAGAQRPQAVFSTECGGSVNSVAFIPDGQRLASAGWSDGKILLWDVASKSSAARILAFYSISRIGIEQNRHCLVDFSSRKIQTARHLVTLEKSEKCLRSPANRVLLTFA